MLALLGEALLEIISYICALLMCEPSQYLKHCEGSQSDVECAHRMRFCVALYRVLHNIQLLSAKVREFLILGVRARGAPYIGQTVHYVAPSPAELHRVRMIPLFNCGGYYSTKTIASVLY